MEADQANLAAAHRALAALASRFDGLRHCPDCGVSLEEQQAHGETCPVGVAWQVLKAPEGTAYLRWARVLEALAEEAAQFVARSFTQAGETLGQCGTCKWVSADGQHAEGCPLAGLHAAVRRLMQEEA